jgi:hypothetical protein
MFARQDYVEEAWRIIDPVLKAATPLTSKPNSWGPSGVERLLPEIVMKLEVFADSDSLPKRLPLLSPPKH